MDVSISLVKPLFLSFLVVFVYVGSLYVWKHKIRWVICSLLAAKCNASPLFLRNDPTTIKLRFISVTFTCVFATILVWMFVPREDGERLCDQLGSCIHEISFMSVFVIPLIITAILYLGPLVVLKDTYTLSEFKDHLREEFSPTDLTFLRNYVVAPISEDFIFRAVMVSFMRGISLNPWFLTLGTSIIFSLGHSHHYFFQRYQGDMTVSVNEWMFQLMYTFLFGCYCCMFYLKTGSFLTPVILHSFCNFMGFPDIDTLYSRSKYWRATIAGAVAWLIIINIYLW